MRHDIWLERSMSQLFKTASHNFIEMSSENLEDLARFRFPCTMHPVAYRGSTHWGGGGGGAPSSGVMSQNIWGAIFFIFRLENVQSGAYLRRKFRLDDMYYMGKRVTIRPTGKRVFFFMNSET